MSKATHGATGFETVLFDRVADEDLARLTPAVRSALADHAIKQLNRRSADAPLIDILDGAAFGLANTFVFEAINDDRRFLLDSTLQELQERRLLPSLVAHPILATARDKTGVLNAAPTLATPETEGNRESYIHIHLPRLSASEAGELKTALAAVYTHVHDAAADLAAMRKRVKEASASYRQSALRLPMAEMEEALAFLEWISSDHMTMLGMREYTLSGSDQLPETVKNSGLGILRNPEVSVLRRGRSDLVMTPEIKAFLNEPQALIITKANVKSLVHRRVHMDYVGVKLFDKEGAVTGELRIVGLLSAAAYSDPVGTIPYIRRKVEHVLAKAGYPDGSHSSRLLRDVLESYPRDELFQIKQDKLDRFAMDILALADRPRIRALPRVDRFDRFVSILVYVPKDRYDSEVRRKLGVWLAETYKGRVSAAYPSYPDGPLARTHFIIGRDEGTTPAVDQQTLEDGIAAIVQTWNDDLREAAINHGGADALISRYADGFGAAYREAFPVEQAIEDMTLIDRLGPDRKRLVNFYRRRSEEMHRANLKVFSLGEAVTLSERVPLLEGLGFRVVNERTYRIVPPGAEEANRVWLHDMTLERTAGGAIDIEAVDPRIEAALMALFHGQMESDRLNALILEAGLAWREAAMLRTLSRYAQQIRAPYSQDYIADTLKKHVAIAKALVALFEARFDPRRTDSKRAADEAAKSAEIDTLLGAVQSLDEDRILRLFRNLIQAAVRTSYYQLGADGRPRPVIAFKFDAAKINGLPLPRPLFEIFLHSPRVEGVHMRFGKVARGGIRWSDRPQDFRTEVLGLVKAQQVKNAVIVPVGAKGGFVPKHLPPASDRAAWLAEGTEAYKIFISTLLHLTDNLKGEKTTPPADTVRHDPDDAYLVVAADKGTATFSDTANGISDAHNHWLGDAFASGGSVGYDHKKMGITARGAWEAVKRHFREMDTDIQTTPFTVAGVGDMSGDVFGNGMLLSEKIKLVAAFDHRDIFIDPTPDVAKTFAERARMFALPRSSWQDYDKSLISKGGGIFPRSSKEIPVSAEMKALLGLTANTTTPQELMNHILKADVDLLWFGGIGTYIRASSETDADAGDRANDAIRITGADLRCKVIGEGANLGLTQRARIEAGRSGVRLNTDAIDNSAGVNSSDVEVNIKIALSTPMTDGRLTFDTRNPLLASMTDDVGKLVLRNNYLQSLALSLTEAKGVADIADERRLMHALEAAGRLDRKVEYLPEDAALDQLERQGQGLTRPEMAVLLAYAKLAFHDDVLASDVPDDPYFAVELKRYFPDGVRVGYPDAVDTHRLRREIIATGLANAVINRGGPSVAIRLAEDTGRSIPDVARAYALTRDAFGVLDLNTAIDALDAKISGAVQLELYSAVQQFTVNRMMWFMRHIDFAPGLSALVERFQKGVSAVQAGTASKAWLDKGVPSELAAQMARLEALAAVPDAVMVGEQAGIAAPDAVTLLDALANRLDVQRLRAFSQSILPADSFERQAVMRMGDTLDGTLRRLAVEVAASTKPQKGSGLNVAQAVESWAGARQSDLARTAKTMADMLAGQPSLAKLSVATGSLSDLPRG
ncbi:MAG: NAD-glutamate dehydrogenase [Beijerinckiaceae bacterium]